MNCSAGARPGHPGRRSSGPSDPAIEAGRFTRGSSALTAAELRVLPMLSAHLSFPEIAAEMSLSRNTVKSQAISIYRKLVPWPVTFALLPHASGIRPLTSSCVATSF
jgi:DNA-binding CsgD family transcriptional regulator